MVKPARIGVMGMISLILDGCSFRPAAVNGMSDSGFVSQQIFCVDVDNAKSGKPLPSDQQLSPREAIKKAKAVGLKPCLIYPTFSDKPELRKYRLVFALDVPIIEPTLRQRIADYLISIFSPAADTACNNPARLFYGTNKDAILIDADAVNRLGDIEALLPPEPIEPLPTQCKQARAAAMMPRSKGSGMTNDNIELIKAGNWRKLREILGRNQEMQFDNAKTFFDYMYRKLDIRQLLGIDVQEGEKFRCILHDDHAPSAHIHRDNNGLWKYHCFGCGLDLNIKRLVEVLTDAKSEYRVIEFIKKVYNLKIAESDWSKEQKANIDSILRCLYGCERDADFATICPTASKTTRCSIELYTKILTIAKDRIFPDVNSSQQIIFPMSIRELSAAVGCSSIGKVSQKVKQLVYHKMIEIVPDDEIPPAILRKALAGRKDEKHKHTEFYRIPSWVLQQTQKIEQQGVQWKNKGYRIKAVSRELFLRSEGVEVANALYPQSSSYIDEHGLPRMANTSAVSNDRLLKLSEIALQQIEEKGYTTETSIIQLAREQMSGNIAETQLRKGINEMLDTYNLHKVRANKAIKVQYSIDSKGYPVIIVPES